MIFDVIVRQGYNEAGKQIIDVLRVHDVSLSAYLRKMQDEKKYIISVIPLFRKREEGKEEVREQVKSDEEKFNDELAGF